MINLLLIMPADTLEQNLPEATLEAIKPLNRVYPCAKMPGTVEHNGKMIHHTVIRCPIDAATIEGMIKANGLNWQLVGMVDCCKTPTGEVDENGNPVTAVKVHMPLDATAIAPFIAPTVDHDGKEAPRVGKVQLHQYSGTEPWYIEL